MSATGRSAVRVENDFYPTPIYTIESLFEFCSFEKVTSFREPLSDRAIVGLDVLDYDEYYEVIWYYDEGTSNSMNIYELAHKCKEWAYSKNYDIRSCLGVGVGYAWIFEGGAKPIRDFHCTSEQEAIFKACQWILENKDKK